MTLSIKQACKVLGISRTTLNRRMKTGELQCTRSGPQEKFEQTVSFTPEQLGLDEEQVQARLSGRVEPPQEERFDGPLAEYAERPARRTVAPVVVTRPAPDISTPGAFAPRPLSTVEHKQLSDLEFADAYKAGEATDSCGNTITGGNRLWQSKGPITVLGPVEPAPPPGRITCDSHMRPGINGRADVPNHPVNSEATRELWHPGTAARMEKMRLDYGLSRKPTQQEQKQALDRAAIATAWRRGISR